MAEIKPVKITDTIYHIYESCGVYCTLVLGTKAALLIDTGYGFGDILNKVRDITDLPLKVINTHGHVDHIQGNKYFDSVMIHENDRHLARFHSSLLVKYLVYKNLKNNLTDEEKKNVPKFFKPNKQKLVYIHEGCKIDLGNRVLEVLYTPGHTKGSICILDTKDRILFTGDTLSSHVWLFLRESTSVPTYIESISRIAERKSEFDKILSAHSAAVFKATLIEKMLHCARHISPAQSTEYIGPAGRKGLLYAEGFEKIQKKYGFKTVEEFLQHGSEVSLIDLEKFEFTSIVYDKDRI